LSKNITDITTKIEARISKKIFNSDFDLNGLFESMLYSISGGKYFRSILLLGLCESGNNQQIDLRIIDLCVAIEMMQTFTLIHDDLPAIDNDDYRRGKLSNHKKYGENVAILTGDALLIDAFEIISSSSYESDVVVKIINIFAKTFGSTGVVGGQFMDIKKNENIHKINYLKTAKFFILCGEIANVIGDIYDKKMIIDFCYNFGMLFQIVDDIKDGSLNSKSFEYKIISEKIILMKKEFFTNNDLIGFLVDSLVLDL
jgi:geranylgeranyl diphosphate synthase type II